MGKLKIVSKFKPTGDQPEAINSLVEGIDYSIEYPSGSNFILPGIKTGHLYGIESAWMKDSKDFTY